MREQIFELLNEKVNEVYLHFQEELNIVYGDITVEQLYRQNEILEDLAELIDSVLTMEMNR